MHNDGINLEVTIDCPERWASHDNVYNNDSVIVN